MKNLQAVCVRSKVFGNHICLNERKYKCKLLPSTSTAWPAAAAWKSVTRLLEGVEGVEKAEVSLENKNAVITFDESKTDADALIDAVEDGGFDIVL